MSDKPASALARTALGDLEHEIASTRRLLEAVPDAHLDWRPHAKSWTLGELATHVANLLRWPTMTLADDGFDLAGSPRNPPASSRDELLRTLDGHAERLRAALATADDAHLMGAWTLRNGAHEIFSMPRLAVMRGFGISHLIHHRGQLTVYLRLLDVPVPGLYGPSADERT